MADAEVLESVRRVEEALGDGGRVLVRESGTEPLVRVMVEAETGDLCWHYVNEVVKVIKSRGYAVSSDEKA